MTRELASELDVPSRETLEGCFLSVLILAEDAESGRRAIDTYGRLVLLAGADFEFQSHFWRFELLEIPKLRETAAVEAADADIIIVSARAASHLSAAVDQWFAMWTDNRTGRPGALVELLADANQQPQATSQIHLRLRVAAYRAGLEFFSKNLSTCATAIGQAEVKSSRLPAPILPLRLNVVQRMAAHVTCG